MGRVGEGEEKAGWGTWIRSYLARNLLTQRANLRWPVDVGTLWGRQSDAVNPVNRGAHSSPYAASYLFRRK
jgi:hypothetical protein